MTKIAVVGYRGFIGSHLTAALETRGHIVRTIGRGDYMYLNGCEVVYNAGGVTGGGALLRSDPLAMVGSNLRLALDVFDAAKRDGVRHVIAMSSTTGYPESDKPLEEWQYFTGDVYSAYANPGETRRFIEKLGRMYPFDLTFVRCPGAYGPRDDYDPDTSHVIGATIRKIAERQDPIICWGDGEDARDGTYIDDLIDALLLMMPLQGQRSVNIGTGTTMTINRMIEVLAKHEEYSPRVEHDLTKPQMIKARLLDMTYAEALLGWYPKVTMEDGICWTLDWYARKRLLT